MMLKRKLLFNIVESLKCNEYISYCKPNIHLLSLSFSTEIKKGELEVKQKKDDKLESYNAIHVRTPNEPYCPWTPTKDLKKKKHYFKRMAFLLQTIEEEREKELKEQKNFPKFKTGNILKLTLSVPENHHKIEEFTGVCIAINRRGIRTTFTIRKTIAPDIGIEKLFPLYCPTIKKIEIKGSLKARKSKLYHLREDLKATSV